MVQRTRGAQKVAFSFIILKKILVLFGFLETLLELHVSAKVL
jgi:hypothetical protein